MYNFTSDPLVAAVAISGLDDTLGAIYIGNLLAAILYGVTCVQTYFYYMHNSASDNLVMKGTVLVLWILDSLHVAFISHVIYFYTVSHFGNVLVLVKVTWSVIATMLITTTSDSIVRGVFACRVWSLSRKNRPLVTLIALSSLVVLASGILFAVRCWQIVFYPNVSQISWIVYLSYSSAAAADIVIAVSLCVLLRKHDTGFKRSKHLVRTLTLYTINTTALTSMCAVLCVVTYAAMPTNFVFITFSFILPKLYFNSLLASLNARTALRENYYIRDNVPLVSIANSTFASSSAMTDTELVLPRLGSARLQLATASLRAIRRGAALSYSIWTWF